MTLLEHLKCAVGCEYISDLPFEVTRGNHRIADEIMNLRLQDYSQRDWNDALEYLAHHPAQNTAEDARMLLLRSLTDLKKSEQNK